VIRLYTWSTPNGRKVSIALEELGLPYNVVTVNIGKDEQFDPDFLKISPNNKIPAIVDSDFTLFESGAILLYLAEKTGMLAPPHGTPEYWRVVEWLMWQMGGFGPSLGQAHHFLKFNPGVSDYAEKRYRGEALRLYRVLDERLNGREYVCDDFSVADIAMATPCPGTQARFRCPSL
jgi:GST-like protein